MRRMISLTAFLVLVGCASRTPPPPGATAPVAAPTASPPTPAAPPQPAQFLPSKHAAGAPFAGGDGSSVEQAVVVLAETEDEGIELEHHWTFDHYGRFRKVRGGLAAADGKHYDVITVELADHSEKTIYFDITGFYGVMEKPEAPPNHPYF